MNTGPGDPPLFPRKSSSAATGHSSTPVVPSTIAVPWWNWSVIDALIWTSKCGGVAVCLYAKSSWIRENPKEPQGCDVGLYCRSGKRLVAQESNEQRDFLDGDGGSANGKLGGERLVFVPACPVYLHC